MLDAFSNIGRDTGMVVYSFEIFSIASSYAFLQSSSSSTSLRTAIVFLLEVFLASQTLLVLSPSLYFDRIGSAFVRSSTHLVKTPIQSIEDPSAISPCLDIAPYVGFNP